MEEKCGTTQVDEGAASDAAGSSGELIGDVCGGGCTQNNPNSICMPICFLVREQAKSLVAIKDLQKRIHQIEGVQGDVISAISDVHDYITSGADSGSLRASVSPRSCPSKSPLVLEKSPYLDVPSVGSSPSPLRSKLANSKFAFAPPLTSEKQSGIEANFHQQAVGAKLAAIARGKDSAPESDKQDSGLDSDCREQGQESNPSQSDGQCLYSVAPPVPAQNHSDELLDLLEEIGEKSEILRQHVSGLEDCPNPCPQFSDEMTKLQLEQLGLRNLLCDIKEERDDLKAKLMDLENTTGELAVEKKDLEQRFISALVEKHKLETKIQAIKPYSAKNVPTSHRNGRVGDDVNLSSIAKRLVYKVDGETVSSVLKETNTIELQKQVLTYMMENEVLRTKLDQVGQLMASKEMEKECLEKVLRDEVRQLMYENEQLNMGYDEQKMEVATLLSRVRMLEKVIQSMTIENQELNNQLGESLYFRDRLRKGRYAAMDHLSSSGSCPPVRRFSLPAQRSNDPDISVSCAKAKLLSNTSSFIDVTIEDSDATERELALTIEPSAFNRRKVSTPLNPGKKHENPTFSDLPSSPFGLATDSHLSACHVPERKPNKRLTFNSMKTLANPHFPGREPYKNRAPNHSVTCDRTRRNLDTSGIRPLESIQEKNLDSKTFPFFTILEKLKASSDYKLSSQVPLHQQRDPNGSETDSSSNLNESSSKHPVPTRKNSNTTSETTQEGTANQTKDKRGGPKNIHRRIQNILDRITAESDAASAVPSSMI